MWRRCLRQTSPRARTNTCLCDWPAGRSPSGDQRSDGSFGAVPRCIQSEGELTVLTDQETSERTAGGLIGKLAGKAKEATGTVIGNDALAREGRLQQAQVDAQSAANAKAAEAKQRDAEASLEAEKAETALERQRLQNQVAAETRDEQIESDRRAAENKANADALRQHANAESQRHAQESAAADAEKRAEHERLMAAEEAVRLEQQARRAEAQAQAIDPKENQ
jgi:uncharacterized protein YjbJ (UPF0337 family)